VSGFDWLAPLILCVSVSVTCWMAYDLWRVRRHKLAAKRKEADTHPKREVGYPYRERLDGALRGGGKPVARFYRNGQIYTLSSDTHYAVLEAISDWMIANPGADPFVEDSSSRLHPRPEIVLPKGTTLNITLSP